MATFLALVRLSRTPSSRKISQASFVVKRSLSCSRVSPANVRMNICFTSDATSPRSSGISS
jgi:hypothetical protein